MKRRLKESYKLSPQLLLPWHPGRTVSVIRAAELLGCSQSTILRLVQDGSLEGFKKRHRNSAYLIIYESVCRLADRWRRETGQTLSQSTSAAPVASLAVVEGEHNI